MNYVSYVTNKPTSWLMISRITYKLIPWHIRITVHYLGIIGIAMNGENSLNCNIYKDTFIACHTPSLPTPIFPVCVFLPQSNWGKNAQKKIFKISNVKTSHLHVDILCTPPVLRLWWSTGSLYWSMACTMLSFLLFKSSKIYFFFIVRHTKCIKPV